jgi:hypothetical protein
LWIINLEENVSSRELLPLEKRLWLDRMFKALDDGRKGWAIRKRLYTRVIVVEFSNNTLTLQLSDDSDYYKIGKACI